MTFCTQAFLFPGEAIIIGVEQPSASHAHLAIQITIGLGQSVSYEDASGATLRARAFSMASLERHGICSTVARANLYIDPSTRLARHSGRQPAVPSKKVLQALESELISFAARPRTREEAARLLSLWKSMYFVGIEHQSAPDARIDEALDFLNDAGVGDVDRYLLADRAKLSPSRFAALFAAGVGMPLRRYLIWRRLLTAVRLMAKGANVTEAAHESGFADTGHMSRVFLKTFGWSPSLFRKMRCLTTLDRP